MTFREQLKKAKELNLCICDLLVAYECDCSFTFDYTETEFEQLCGLVCDCYLAVDNVNVDSLAYAIEKMVSSGKKTIEQVVEMSKWELLDKA